MFVYVITCHVDGKRYVGKANMPAKRWTAHKATARAGNGSPLYSAMREHGVDAFSFEVVEECESEEASFEAEKAWIAKLGTTVSAGGYNLTGGGEGLTGCMPSTREKMSAAKRGKAQPTEHVARRAASLRENGKKAAVLERVLELHGKGLMPADIAKLVKRSGARVCQLLSEAGVQGPGRGRNPASRRKPAPTDCPGTG